MPTTNRPFFANFFAAFRAHSVLPKASPATLASTTTTTATGTNPTSVTTSPTASQARPINTKSPPPTTSSTAAAVAAHAAAQISSQRGAQALSPRTRSTSPLPCPSSPTARSPGPRTPPTGSFQRGRTPSETGMPQRRASSSSSDRGSLKDALGHQAWYIGGRTASGEETYYRLGMMRRYTSADKLSLDRLSL